MNTNNTKKNTSDFFELEFPVPKYKEKELKKAFSKKNISEYKIYKIYPDLLDILLKDRTTGKNIIWATDDYEYLGGDYNKEKEIKPNLISIKNKEIIIPRVQKNKHKQSQRTKERAEVFTPSWVCNCQNNLIDNAWFGYNNIFNFEIKNNTWRINNKKIKFKDGKTWQDYVKLPRMEITCGEAPYLVSRYDTVTGKNISIKRRIGLLDRKLRIISENTNNKYDWLYWTKIAYKNIYGFEFQGDNVLLAREALLAVFFDYYKNDIDDYLSINTILDIAEIISWNIWQMDGLTYMPPYEVENKNYKENDLFLNIDGEEKLKINLFSKIKNWDTGEEFTFKSLLSKEE